MKLNNKGLTLVEVLVVLAILGILGGLATMGISAAVSKPADECAEKMAASLKNGRLSTMGKHEIELRYYQTADGAIYLEESITRIKTDGETSTTMDVTKIGEKGVQVEYTLTDGTTKQLSEEDLVLSFKRSSGGFNTCNGTSAYCKEIKVSKGSRLLTLELQYLTGKVTVK